MSTVSITQCQGAVRRAERDHIFLSYAWEDRVVAEWLARKLAAEGYAVWIDRFKMLGGERWPEDIDVAIKERTFRMVALLSRHSIHKPNPSKERQMALGLSRKRGEADFLIPLNLDGLHPTELDWQLADINWIPFERWGEGFDQLLQKLDAIGAPRALGQTGAEKALESLRPADVLADADDPVVSNCLPVTHIPDVVFRYQPSRPLLATERDALLSYWAFEGSKNGPLYAFVDPPGDAVLHCAPECIVARAGGSSWRDVRDIDGTSSAHIVRSLVRKSLDVCCVARGLILDRAGRYAYFPDQLLTNERLAFRGYNGRSVTIVAAGERKIGAGRFRYQLGVSFWVRHDVVPESLLRDHLVVQSKIVLHITEPGQGGPLQGAATNARRKKIAKSWWNHEWVSRQLAMAQYLADGAPEIVVGAAPQEQMRVGVKGLSTVVRPAIRDAELKSLAAKIAATDARLDALEDEGDVPVTRASDHE